MSDVKKLLADATPLPWEQGDIEPSAVLARGRGVVFRVNHVGNEDDAARDAALVVHAVNHLPDYLAAVEVLRTVAWNHEYNDDWPLHCGPADSRQDNWTECNCPQQAREVLRRLRDEA